MKGHAEKKYSLWLCLQTYSNYRRKMTLIHSKVYEQSYFNLHSDSVELSIKSRPGWRVRVLLNLVEYWPRSQTIFLTSEKNGDLAQFKTYVASSYCKSKLKRNTYISSTNQDVFDTKFNYSRLPITGTLTYSNLALTRTKIDFTLHFRHTFTVIVPSFGNSNPR